MPNPIKYSTGSETLALKKGNFYIGTGDVGKGPTESTGYYNGITPPTSGYTIYLNKASQGPSIYVASTDNDLMTIGSQVVNKIKNFAKPLNEWVVIRSVVTEITDGSITPPFTGAKVWSCVINTSLYPNTLHRIWSFGSQNGIIGTLGNGFYRYYLWVRGKSTNTDSAWIQIDISDGKSSSVTTIGKNENWVMVEVWDSTSGNYSSDKFFDIAFNNTNGDTFYISSIVIAASDTADTNKLGVISYNPGYINYSSSISPSFTSTTDFLLFTSKYNDVLVTNIDYPSIITDGLVLNLDAGFVPSYPRSGTTWSDISLSGNSGTLTNGPTYSADGGGSLVFDGVDDYVGVINTLLNNYLVITVEVYSNVTDFLREAFFFGFTSYGVYVRNVVGTNSGLGYNTGAGDLYGIPYSAVTSLNLQGTWNYYSFVMFNNVNPTSNPYSNNKMYINGNEQTLSQQRGSQSSSTRTFNSTLTINGWNNSVGNKLPMKYSQFRIYNRVLTQTEIQQNYYSTLWRFLPNITQSNLILYLDATSTFSYVSGATSWYNLSSSGLTGTLVNGPTYSTEDGGNITFDGTDDRVNIATYAPTSQLMSFDFWIKVPSPLGSVQSIFGDGNQNNTVGYIWIYYNSNGSVTYQFATSTVRSQVSATIFSSGYTDAWVNLTVTVNYTSKEIKFYRNRQLISTQTMTDASFPSANRIRYIGNYAGSTSSPGKLSLSSFIWYSSILSATQVSQNFSSTVWRFLPNIVQSGLVLYVDAGYSFSYVSGATTWYDISSTNVNSTLTNGPTYSTNGGGSILLDGVDDYIPTNSTVSLTANWTVEAWFNLTSYPVLANVFSTAYGEGWYASSLFGGGKTIGWYLDSGWRSTAGNLYTTNQWYHLVAIVSGKNHYYYLNGVQVFSYTTNNTPSSVTFGNFGRIYGTNERYFPGYIALGRCYNRALTADEVLQNYNAQKSRFGL